ncbi:hypothetical protein G5C51_31570 [Streptomyces sp. A7024]|uniref:Uncharacterized protein n=2 Tax=Streptomyces coryli TaxID=1128680 RepID=A0A6G4U8A8_9ACTN|nr:hypothetical protein [Streptomyces coryli]NGN68424.1 hypothetical protein [Streptomyces coryli]
MAAVLAAVLAGCGAPSAGERAAEVQRMLDRRGEALVRRDEGAFLNTAAPGDRQAQRRVFGNLADVPLDSYSYRLKSGLPDGSPAEATLEIGYRLRGYDTAAVTTTEQVLLRESDGRWYVSWPGRSTAGERQQLWDQGRVQVVRGKRSIVLGVGRSEAWLRSIAAAADRAVPAADRAWSGTWARRVVIFAPESLAAMARMLGSPPADYRGMAAVTTGEAGAGRSAPADRVVVNPEAYDLLGEVGRRIVLTHEITHVATRAATTSATPLWLSEGFADWSGYRAASRTPRQGAPELARAVAGGYLPQELPKDRDFRFGSDQDALARAYEEAWLACVLIAERWGQEKLEAVYRGVGKGGRVGAVLQEELGVGLGEFTESWRSYLRAQLG